MIERALSLGDPSPLVGVLTEPDPQYAGRKNPAVILLNAGLLHRVGPHRLYVDLARQLAAAGFLTVRIDLSGLGDSASRQDTRSFEEGSVDDTLRVMNYLQETRGITSFIIGGLCSGADNAFWTSAVDPRITGVMLLDWYAYRTFRFYLHHYGPRLFRPRVWANKLALVAWLLRQPVGSQPRTPGPEGPGEVQLNPFARAFPPKETVTPLLRSVLDRGVRMLCVYTRGQLDYYNYASQFHDMFRSIPVNGQVRTEFLSTADHTFTLRRDQLRLLQTVMEWVKATDWSKARTGNGNGNGHSGKVDRHPPSALARAAGH